MPPHDDRFRQPGSQFENEEVFAIALIPMGKAIAWSNEDDVPAHTLWLPETLYHEVAHGTLLNDLQPYSQNRLALPESRGLAKQLEPLVFSVGPVAEAAALVWELAARVTDRQELLIEGP